MEYYRGLLWIKDPSDVEGGKSKAPVLASTEKVLQQLKYPLPLDQGTFEMPGNTEEESEVTIDLQGEDGDNDDEEVDVPLGNEENDDAEADADAEDGAEAPKGEKKPSVLPEYIPFQSLERASNQPAPLGESLRIALNDIKILKQRSYDRPKRERLTRLETQEKALAHSQKRFQEHQEKSEGGKTQSSKEATDTEEGGDVDLAGVESKNEDNAEEDSIQLDPFTRIASTLNSLRILTPLVRSIVLHSRRNDQKLVIGDTTLANKGRNPRCWLLGEFVYDQTTVRHCKSIYRDLLDLWALCGIDLNGVGTLWKETIDEQMTLTISLHGKDSLKSTLAQKMPWDEISDDKRKSFHELCQSLDLKFGFIETRDKKERELYQEAINTLQKRVQSLLRGRYSDATVSVYGSCLSDLSLGKSSDVDLSLFFDAAEKINENFRSGKITANKYQKEMKSMVYGVCRKLEGLRNEFSKMNPVPRARIPVVRGCYLKASNPYSLDGSIDFDICFLNDIAVANSSMLREYTLVDPRAKQLMIAVKQWAKKNGISSAKDNHLSSYAWINLVIFYLQHVGLVPNLQSTELMGKASMKPNKENRWHSVNKLDTFYLTWDAVKPHWQQNPELASASVTSLLYGFFRFYAKDFPTTLAAISIKNGGTSALIPKTIFRKCSLFYCIEDPFETHDSHTPHDLGMPAEGGGMMYIVRCIRSTEAYMRNQLEAALPESGGIDSVESLWPEMVADQKKTGRRRGRGDRKQEAAKKQQQGGGGREATNKATPEKTIDAAPSNDAKKEQSDVGDKGDRQGRGRRGRGNANKNQQKGDQAADVAASTVNPEVKATVIAEGKVGEGSNEKPASETTPDGIGGQETTEEGTKGKPKKGRGRKGKDSQHQKNSGAGAEGAPSNNASEDKGDVDIIVSADATVKEGSDGTDGATTKEGAGTGAAPNTSQSNPKNRRNRRGAKKDKDTDETKKDKDPETKKDKDTATKKDKDTETKEAAVANTDNTDGKVDVAGPQKEANGAPGSASDGGSHNKRGAGRGRGGGRYGRGRGRGGRGGGRGGRGNHENKESGTKNTSKTVEKAE